jgi:MOSC domain-containing protein YiiM
VAHTYNFQGLSILPTEGIFCRVIESGWVRKGDEIIVKSATNQHEGKNTN